jgi:hypothetical protein
MAALDLFDSYTLRARIAPALVATLPLGLGFAAWFPVGDQLKAVPAGAVVAIGLATLVAHLGRDLGKKKESRLFARWGGPPTTTLLSYSHSTLSRNTLQQIHERLRQVTPERNLPISSEEELLDQGEAVRAYEGAVAWLREHTRDKQAFSLVAEENANYGFRRNLWALKPAGIFGAVCGGAIAIARLLLSLGQGKPVDPYVALYAAVALAMLVLWILWVKPEWVRVAGDAYAERLLLSVDRAR